MFLSVITNADLYFDRKLSFLRKKWFIIDDVIENWKITKFHFFWQKLTFVNNVFLHLNSSNLYGYMSVLRIYGHLFCSYHTYFNIKSIQTLAFISLNMHVGRSDWCSGRNTRPSPQRTRFDPRDRHDVPDLAGFLQVLRFPPASKIEFLPISRSPSYLFLLIVL